MSRRTALFHSCITALLLVGCDFTRFDDFKGQAPIVELHRPSNELFGFGSSLAVGTRDGTTGLLVAGAPGAAPAALFPVNDSENPAVDAEPALPCEDRTSCRTANQVAYLERDADGHEHCFAFGVRTRSPVGIALRCSGTSEFVYPLPKALQEEYLGELSRTQKHQPLRLATSRGGEGALLVAASGQRSAWYYAPGSKVPVELPADAGSSFGETVAALRPAADGAQLLAVGQPSKGRVWLYRVGQGVADAGAADAAVPFACVERPSKFGLTLAAGDVDGDGADDLVVADTQAVQVLSGAVLASLAPGGGCTSLLPDGAEIGQFECASGGGVGGCEDSAFGAALAVADLDGDGDGEIVVGAPRMAAAGVTAAGVLLIYDGEKDRSPADWLYLSSAGEEDGFGSAVVALPHGERDVLAASGPTHDRVVIAFCSGLLDADQRVGRCAR